MNKFLTLPPTVQLLCIGSLINRAGQMLVVFLTIYLTEHLNFTEQFASYCFGAFGLGAIFAALIGGYLADVVGRKVVMLVALLGGGAVLVVFSFLTNQIAIIAMIMVFAFVSEMYRPASQAMIADVVSSEQRPHAFTLIYLAINLGFAVAPAIGAALIRWFSFKAVFWFDAGTSLIFGAIIFAMIKETLPNHASNSREDRPSSGAETPPQSSDDSQNGVRWSEALWRILGDRVFIIFCLATFFVAVIYIQGLSSLPLYLGRLGFGADDFGGIIMVNGVMIVLLQIPITSVVVKFDRGAVVALAAILSGLGFMLTDYGYSAWGFRLTVMVWTMGEMMAMPLVAAIVADLAPLRLRARYMGVYTMSYSGANLIAAPLGGMILVHFGGSVLWRTCFALGILSALLFASIGRSIATPKVHKPIEEPQ
jgi:MFS family permease